MVKLEQEQGGLPEFGTVLQNPDFAAVARAIGFTGIRVDDPANVDEAVRQALAEDGPVLLDVLTNPEEISLPGKVKASQAWSSASRDRGDRPELRRSLAVLRITRNEDRYCSGWVL